MAVSCSVAPVFLSLLSAHYRNLDSALTAQLFGPSQPSLSRPLFSLAFVHLPVLMKYSIREAATFALCRRDESLACSFNEYPSICRLYRLLNLAGQSLSRNRRYAPILVSPSRSAALSIVPSPPLVRVPEIKSAHPAIHAVVPQGGTISTGRSVFLRSTHCRIFNRFGSARICF